MKRRVFLGSLATASLLPGCISNTESNGGGGSGSAPQLNKILRFDKSYRHSNGLKVSISNPGFFTCRHHGAARKTYHICSQPGNKIEFIGVKVKNTGEKQVQSPKKDEFNLSVDGKTYGVDDSELLHHKEYTSSELGPGNSKNGLIWFEIPEETSPKDITVVWKNPDGETVGWRARSSDE